MKLEISKPLHLKCGLTLRNRLVKAAMAESLGDIATDNLPDNHILNVYRKWAEGEWGLVITGNVQVDPDNLGDPKDFAINSSVPKDSTLKAFKAWATVCSQGGSKAIVQICHPGRQIAFHKGGTVAPSVVPMDFGGGVLPRLLNSVVFGTPRAMTVDEIKNTIRQFAEAAQLIEAAGFAGVELHAAHGYLLAQFLSSRSNLRTDLYGGSATSRARIIVEIIQAIRKVVSPRFCIGIKFNSVDVGNVDGMGDCIEQLRAITAANIDFLEISGGSFEDPIFSTGPGAVGIEAEKKKASTIAREAFFLDFARVVRAEFLHLPLMVTGGFRSRKGMEATLAEGSCDLIGLARPSVIDPLLPRRLLLNAEVPDDEAVAVVKKIAPGRAADYLGVKLLGVGSERDWYTKQISRIGTAGIVRSPSSISESKKSLAYNFPVLAILIFAVAAMILVRRSI